MPLPSPIQIQQLKYLRARADVDPQGPFGLTVEEAIAGACIPTKVESLIRTLRVMPSFNMVLFKDFAEPSPYQREEESMTMLEKILKMYVMAMSGDVRSPLPHLVGPAGCGKSTAVEQAAEMLGVNLHILNVSRMSPLDLEGVQMPNHDNTKLTQLTATWWSQLKEGDIVLLDEFLRGFPEVYNGLLDILTSRQVGAFKLPKVFILGASNSVTTYDQALEDRLLHLPVADPRSDRRERARLAEDLVEHIGLMPDMAQSLEMATLLDGHVLPMYNLLDNFKGTGQKVGGKQAAGGSSIRKLIGQARLRMVETPALAELIEMNNIRAAQEKKYQYVLVLDPRKLPTNYINESMKLLANPKLTKQQRLNLELNDQLIQMDSAKTETVSDDSQDKEMLDELFA